MALEDSEWFSNIFVRRCDVKQKELNQRSHSRQFAENVK